MTINQNLPLVIKAHSIHEIIEALDLVRSNERTLHVTSGGWNWGYGETKAVSPESIHLDLSGMNKILSFEPERGILRIEPGVTQGDLDEYLKKHNYDYYVPNTGAGKRGSILGNALERGFGIAPIHDHADSILNVKGLLADGSIYESGLNEISKDLAESFTWGVGPQLDKLVSQSSWVIITEASIQLERKSACTDIFALPLRADQLAPAIDIVRRIYQDNYMQVGSVKIFNQKQVSNINSSEEWVLTLVIYSHPLLKKKYHRMIRNYFREIQSPRKLILDEKKTRILKKLVEMIPFLKFKKFASQLDDFLEMFKLADGRTSEVGYKALDTQYDYQSNDVFNMLNLKSKLTWFSPLCVFEGKEAERLLSLIQKLNTHDKFKFNTYTWTVLNKRTMALVIPIFYESAFEDEFWPWYENIHLELKKEGFIPYRFHIKMMGFLKKSLMPKYFKHVDKLERAFDPDSIIHRGKYS